MSADAASMNTSRDEQVVASDGAVAVAGLAFRRGSRSTRMAAGLFSVAALLAVAAIIVPTFESNILTWLNL